MTEDIIILSECFYLDTSISLLEPWCFNSESGFMSDFASYFTKLEYELNADQLIGFVYKVFVSFYMMLQLVYGDSRLIYQPHKHVILINYIEFRYNAVQYDIILHIIQPKTKSELWTHKKRPISSPRARDIGYFCEYYGIFEYLKKIDRCYIGTALYLTGIEPLLTWLIRFPQSYHVPCYRFCADFCYSGRKVAWGRMMWPPS